MNDGGTGSSEAPLGNAVNLLSSFVTQNFGWTSSRPDPQLFLSPRAARCSNSRHNTVAVIDACQWGKCLPLQRTRAEQCDDGMLYEPNQTSYS